MSHIQNIGDAGDASGYARYAKNVYNLCIYDAYLISLSPSSRKMPHLSHPHLPSFSDKCFFLVNFSPGRPVEMHLPQEMPHLSHPHLLSFFYEGNFFVNLMLGIVCVQTDLASLLLG